VSIVELFRFNYALRHDEERLLRFLKVPLAMRFRAKIEARLDSLGRNSD
jgi:hypothetical protein